VQRRTFLFTSAAAACQDLRQSAPAPVRLGVIGSGGRGTFVMQTFQKDPALKVTAICDVYEPNLENALSKAPGAKAYRDYRRLLEDPAVDAVLIATPEHWHHRQVLDALAAGKDVYVEKPLCQTPEQGVELVRAEKASKQIVQTGMQRRSYDLYLEGRKVVQSGQLGKVRMVRSWWLNNYLQNNIPPTNFSGRLDWEQWQGPIPNHRPFDADRFRNWRQYTDYAGGIVADQGAHVFDGIHLLMSAGYPSAVTAAAGKPHRPGFDTPESVVVTAEYANEDFIGVFSINYAAMRYKSRNDQLNQIDGDQARMDIGREKLDVFPQGAEDTPVLTKTSARGFGYATDLHVQNFLDCVRTRQRPTAPMELGFQAALVVQLANLSLRTGRRMRWNATLSKVEPSS
jgi:predicted dehydrogenase